MVHLYRKRGRPYVGTSQGRHLPRRGREQRGATGPPADPPKRARHGQYMRAPHSAHPHGYQQQKGRAHGDLALAPQEMHQHIHNEGERRVAPHKHATP
eukprot:476469-Pyramimonas_sp.AAC.1